MLHFCYDFVFSGEKPLLLNHNIGVINKILFFNIYLFWLRLCDIVIVAKEWYHYDMSTQNKTPRGASSWGFSLLFFNGWASIQANCRCHRRLAICKHNSQLYLLRRKQGMISVSTRQHPLSVARLGATTYVLYYIITNVTIYV